MHDEIATDFEATARKHPVEEIVSTSRVGKLTLSHGADIYLRTSPLTAHTTEPSALTCSDTSAWPHFRQAASWNG